MDMSEKFTAGKWCIQAQGTSEPFYIMGIDNNVFIAKMDDGTYGDAALIAAAPAMYEALRAVYTHIASGKPWTDEQLDNIDNVLKTAEGR